MPMTSDGAVQVREEFASYADGKRAGELVFEFRDPATRIGGGSVTVGLCEAQCHHPACPTPSELTLESLEILPVGSGFIIECVTCVGSDPEHPHKICG
ncbi:MAG: hypothetical protein KF773_37045 [Deltaproteobacteria bacterium]|nr:hypothetical protein [Deltaproteobacteria bacterium]MCW5804266.1 hypothetical protein [Deltaproteobacteria bacterium]